MQPGQKERLQISQCLLRIVHLENDALEITEWFLNNGMKLNEDKCHLMIFGAKRINETTIKIGEVCVKNVQRKIFSV